MGSNYLIKFLEEKEVPTITKKRHTFNVLWIGTTRYICLKRRCY